MMILGVKVDNDNEDIDDDDEDDDNDEDAEFHVRLDTADSRKTSTCKIVTSKRIHMIVTMKR